ncbi:MAG: DUF523 domain-containing protein [Eggerthellaceae bacterium]|nr:DUF523 domain-containing protein [Eggerthellaceae bacterium]
MSACLLGHACRYDGGSKPHAGVIEALATHETLPVCPEVEGGLPIPHPACEIIADNPLLVRDAKGEDATDPFVKGAEKTLEAINDFGCELAILKAKSPSCGTGKIYDGSFTGTLRDGWGVAAALIRDAGIPCIDETQIDDLLN